MNGVYCSDFTGPLRIELKSRHLDTYRPHWTSIVCVAAETTRYYTKGEELVLPDIDIYSEVKPQGKFGSLLYTGRPDFKALPITPPEKVRY